MAIALKNENIRRYTGSAWTTCSNINRYKDTYWTTAHIYKYTELPMSPDHAHAWVQIFPTACSSVSICDLYYTLAPQSLSDDYEVAAACIATSVCKDTIEY